MHKLIIKGEATFKVLSANGLFAIGPSSSGYTLNYSVDGENFTAWGEASAANENVVVANAPYGMTFKLSGNTDQDVVAIWY